MNIPVDIDGSYDTDEDRYSEIDLNGDYMSEEDVTETHNDIQAIDCDYIDINDSSRSLFNIQRPTNTQVIDCDDLPNCRNLESTENVNDRNSNYNSNFNFNIDDSSDDDFYINFGDTESSADMETIMTQVVGNDKNNERNQNDSDNDSDTVVVDDYPVVFSDTTIQRDMLSVLNELEKVKEEPKIKIEITIGIENEITNALKERIEGKIRKKILKMAQDFYVLKESIRNDYYCIKEFTNPMYLKVLKGSINQRYMYFFEKLMFDFSKLEHYIKMIRNFSFVDINKYNYFIKLYVITINVECDIIEDFNMDNISQKIEYITRIASLTFGKDLESMYKF